MSKCNENSKNTFLSQKIFDTSTPKVTEATFDN